MPTSESEELNEIIRRVFEDEYGMRASHEEVSRTVLGDLPRHILGHYAQRAIKRAVSEFFNKNEDGLPYAPVANAEGEHVQLEIMDFSEYEFVAKNYLRKKKEFEDKAYVTGARAREKFNRDLVVNGVNLSAGVAA